MDPLVKLVSVSAATVAATAAYMWYRPAPSDPKFLKAGLGYVAVTAPLVAGAAVVIPPTNVPMWAFAVGWYASVSLCLPAALAIHRDTQQ